MHILRFIRRIIPVLMCLLLGLAIVTLVFPWIPVRWRSALNHRWSHVLMWLCGVKIRVSGSPVLHAPVLWIANHVSWIDIFCLNRVRTTAFVAKREIRRWPVIGWLVAGAGTIFIERGSRQALRHVSKHMQARWRRGEAVGLFPEGTTSPGFEVLAFHASLFEAAIRSQVDIQPVALRFYHQGVRSSYVAFTGEQTLVANMWRLLGTTGVCVELVFLAPYAAAQCQQQDRHGIATTTQQAIAHALGEC